MAQQYMTRQQYNIWHDSNVSMHTNQPNYPPKNSHEPFFWCRLHSFFAFFHWKIISGLFDLFSLCQCISMQPRKYLPGYWHNLRSSPHKIECRHIRCSAERKCMQAGRRKNVYTIYPFASKYFTVKFYCQRSVFATITTPLTMLSVFMHFPFPIAYTFL